MSSYKSELEAINCCGYCDYRYFYGLEKCLNFCCTLTVSVYVRVQLKKRAHARRVEQIQNQKKKNSGT